MRKLVWFGLVFVLLPMLSLANEEGAQPERKVFGDWFTLCAKPQNICTMNQIQFVNNENGRSQILHAHISKNPQKPEQLIMQLILPLGVVLPAGILVKIDKGKEIQLPYHTCTPKGCIAAMPLPDERYQLLRKGNEALVGFRPIGTDKTAVIKISLNGFTKASNVIRRSANP